MEFAEPELSEEFVTRQGDHGNPCRKAQNAFCLLCCGLFLLPGAWFLLGWNERNFVCMEKNILYAEANAETAKCDMASKYEGAAVYFSCPLDDSTLKTFTPATLNDGMASAGLGSAISFTSAAGAQEASMWQCVEHSRSESSGKQSTRTVYTYTAEWSNSPVDASMFSTSSQAIMARNAACPGLGAGNPKWPTNLRTQEVVSFANTVKAGSFSIQESLVRSLTPDFSRPVPLGDFAKAFTPLSQLPPVPTFGLTQLTLQNVALSSGDNSTLVTCDPSRPTWGCIKIQFFKNWDTAVSAITSVRGGGNTAPIATPASWGCRSGKWEVLYGGSKTKAEIIDSEMDTNQATNWILRVVGCVLAWMAVWCCLQPISAAADIIGDVLHCIPCIGGALENLFEGIVETVVCVVSCGMGCSSALCVIGIVWVVMRPLYGSLLLLAALILCGCGVGIAQMFKSDKKPLASKDIELSEEEPYHS